MLVSIAAVAVLTPYIIARIGRDDFGLWSLVISALGFLSLIDLGFGTGVVKFVAECKASGNVERRNRILSTLSAVYLAIALVSGVCIVALSIFFYRIFAIPPAQGQKATAVLWILALLFVLLVLPPRLVRNPVYGRLRL